jgi:hypothetical protein
MPAHSVHRAGRRIGLRNCLLMIAAGILASCGPPREARVPPSDRIDALPPPELEPTAAFGGSAEEDMAAREENLADADALRARAAALRARAAELSAEPADTE